MKTIKFSQYTRTSLWSIGNLPARLDGQQRLNIDYYSDHKVFINDNYLEMLKTKTDVI